MTNEITETKYLGVAIDPIHSGTGEFSLGRVDNPILRDPATRLPKIAGSSLAGAARAYCAMERDRYVWPDDQKKEQSCAGKGGAEGMSHCGKAICPVCMAFGFSRKEDSFQGLASFSDALLVLFPVSSVRGAVWVTSPGALHDAGMIEAKDWTDWETKLFNGGEYGYWVVEGTGLTGRLNLGWVYLSPAAEAPAQRLSSLPAEMRTLVGSRTVVVSDRLYGHIVNDNLEVRTSVSIDPKTGAAASGALFTSEMMPRGTVLQFSTRLQSGKYFRVPPRGDRINDTDLKLAEMLKKGVEQFALQGVGGLATRGMGRMKAVKMGATA